jgi:hypothetical protein
MPFTSIDIRKFMNVLNEAQILREFDEQKTIQNYGKKIVDAAMKDHSFQGMTHVDPNTASPEAITDAFMALLKQTDPTPHQEYSQWITNMYCKGACKVEDFGRFNTALATFADLKKHKKLKPEHRDINQMRSLQSLESAVDAYQEQKAEIEQPKEEPMKGDAKTIFNSSEIRVVQANDYDAAMYYGRGTKWCTAANSNNQAETYLKSGPLYVIIPKQPSYPREKYQFHFKHNQFMNEMDIRVNLNALIHKYPDLRKVPEFKNQGLASLPFASDEEQSSTIAHMLKNPSFEELLRINSSELPDLYSQYKVALSKKVLASPVSFVKQYWNVERLLGRTVYEQFVENLQDGLLEHPSIQDFWSVKQLYSKDKEFMTAYALKLKDVVLNNPSLSATTVADLISEVEPEFKEIYDHRIKEVLETKENLTNGDWDLAKSTQNQELIENTATRFGDYLIAHPDLINEWEYGHVLEQLIKRKSGLGSKFLVAYVKAGLDPSNVGIGYVLPVANADYIATPSTTLNILVGLTKDFKKEKGYGRAYSLYAFFNGDDTLYNKVKANPTFEPGLIYTINKSNNNLDNNVLRELLKRTGSTNFDQERLFNFVKDLTANDITGNMMKVIKKLARKQTLERIINDTNAGEAIAKHLGVKKAEKEKRTAINSGGASIPHTRNVNVGDIVYYNSGRNKYFDPTDEKEYEAVGVGPTGKVRLVPAGTTNKSKWINAKPELVYKK